MSPRSLHSAGHRSVLMRAAARLLQQPVLGPLTATLVAVLILLVALRGWDKARAVRNDAHAAAASLKEVATAFGDSDERGVQAGLADAEQALHRAATGLNDPALRGAALLPFLRAYLVDTRQVIAAAGDLVHMGSD